MHSPEPWKVVENDNCPGDGPNYRCWIENANGLFVAEFSYDARGERPPLPDAERTAACVNACKGIPTEKLLEISTWPSLAVTFQQLPLESPKVWHQLLKGTSP